MNNYKYKPLSTLFDEKVKLELIKLKTKFNNGEIKTKSDYAYAIKEIVTRFYNKMGKPNFEYIEASDVPNFKDLKTMVDNIKGDMETIITGCSELNKVLDTMNESMLEESTIISKNIEKIEKDIVEIENKIKVASINSGLTYSDGFSNDVYSSISYFENEEQIIACTIINNICFIPTSNKTYERDFDIYILDTSNGFPGNTHEVYESANGIKYTGEINPRLDLNNIKSLNNNDWFEFEMFNVSEEIRTKTSNIGFKYKEGIEWVTDSEELKLDLKIVVKNPKMLNVMNINGIARTSNSVDYPIIRQVIVRDVYDEIQILNEGSFLAEYNTIIFQPAIVKEITISISQIDSATSNIARSYAVSIDPSKEPYYNRKDSSIYSQIDVPLVSINDILLKYNQQTKGIIYPNTTNAQSYISKEYIKTKLFYPSLNLETDNDILTEIIKANRYSIAISNISLMYLEFEQNGTYISKTFEPNKKIKRVTLNAIEYIPNSFDVDTEYIEYFVSFNNEPEWIKIYPRTSNFSNKCSIVINSYKSLSSRDNSTIYIDRLIEATNVRLKIKIKRQIDIPNESPNVKSYNLDIDEVE